MFLHSLPHITLIQCFDVVADSHTWRSVEHAAVGIKLDVRLCK